MTVAELIELLSDLDPEAEVRLAVQPSWPFEHHLAPEVAEVGGRVWLAESGQIGYLPGEVAEELGWT